MEQFNYAGGCHCGNMSLEVVLTKQSLSYEPRACDCSFCRKHQASYLSDPNGRLTIFIHDKSKLGKHRQGSDQADFLICKTCGVLSACCCQIQGKCYAAVNSKIFEQQIEFAQELIASPQQLLPQEKTKRWQKLWFSDVHING